MALSGPFSDTNVYIKSKWDDQDGMICSLPSFVQGQICKLEADQAYHLEEYQEVNEVLEKKLPVGQHHFQIALSSLQTTLIRKFVLECKEHLSSQLVEFLET
eukprot:10401106-Ditylum_brightwellii.AAC.1